VRLRLGTFQEKLEIREIFFESRQRGWNGSTKIKASGDNALEFKAFDDGYVEYLRLGDRATEDHFVSYFSELIDLKLRSRLQLPQSIQDIRQETFARVLKLLRQENGIRQGEHLGSLVNSICNNVMFEHYRASKRAEPLDELVSENLLDRQPDALRQAISRQTQGTVHEVLETLGERDRLVLRMLFVEERDKDGVCEALGVDRDYIRVLVFRAKKAFREKFDAGSNAKTLMLSNRKVRKR
jgi:RNA polymerase sigma-70 factor (ECF subfamily)